MLLCASPVCSRLIQRTMSSATNASVVDSSQTSAEGISATAPRALVSPPAKSAHASGEAHKDIACTLFNGNEDINVEDIASLHICPLSQEPPFQGVHFDIPDTRGQWPHHQTVTALQVDRHSRKPECPSECVSSLKSTVRFTFCCMEFCPSSLQGTTGSPASRASCS